MVCRGEPLQIQLTHTALKFSHSWFPVFSLCLCPLSFSPCPRLSVSLQPPLPSLYLYLFLSLSLCLSLPPCPSILLFLPSLLPVFLFLPTSLFLCLFISVSRSFFLSLSFSISLSLSLAPSLSPPFSLSLSLSLSLAVKCSPLTAPVHGTVSVKDGVATYTCVLGWTLAGNATRKCSHLGGWEGTEPNCEREFNAVNIHPPPLLLVTRLSPSKRIVTYGKEPSSNERNNKDRYSLYE